MRFLKVPFMRCQALMRKRERKGRRKWELPESSCLGHTVKSRMTAISRWSAIKFIKADRFGILKQGMPAIYPIRWSFFSLHIQKGKRKGGFTHGNFYRSGRGNRHTDA